MYTFDLLKAELLIAHAATCNEAKGKHSGTIYSAIAAMAEIAY